MRRRCKLLGVEPVFGKGTNNEFLLLSFFTNTYVKQVLYKAFYRSQCELVRDDVQESAGEEEEVKKKR